ncbi:hypothetical protein RJ639_003255 [Escallonia herrerae]|uniref:TPX2 C-terminal domain-containing protein n=1 Tax=Escallonia herrerae TaxID=1293975 RepID=A0AA89B020_9ASTE|nr:hypothetical protein RJ639_003255 [Escallonia herrerae]
MTERCLFTSKRVTAFYFKRPLLSAMGLFNGDDIVEWELLKVACLGFLANCFKIFSFAPQEPLRPSSSQPPQPSTSQPSSSLPAKNALGDVKDQAEVEANPKPWYTADEKSSKMSTNDLVELFREYPLPKGWYARLPNLQEPAHYGTKYFFVGRSDKGKLPFDREWNPYCKDFENPGKPAPNNLTKHILSHIKLWGGLSIDEPLSEQQLEWARIIPRKPVPAGAITPPPAPTISSTFPAESAPLGKWLVEMEKHRKEASLVFRRKAKGKRKEKQPSTELPPAMKKTRVIPPDHSPQIVEKVSIEEDPIFLPRWTLRCDDAGMPDSQISEQHLVHGVLPWDKEVFQNQTHETFACSFAQAVYTMYASGSEMLSCFEMARQVAAKEAQQKREAIKEAVEATRSAEELSKQETDYLAQIETLERRLERAKRRVAEEVRKARDQGIHDFLDGNAGDGWLKKRADDGLEIYELGFVKAKEISFMGLSSSFLEKIKISPESIFVVNFAEVQGSYHWNSYLNRQQCFCSIADLLPQSQTIVAQTLLEKVLADPFPTLQKGLEKQLKSKGRPGVADVTLTYASSAEPMGGELGFWLCKLMRVLESVGGILKMMEVVTWFGLKRAREALVQRRGNATSEREEHGRCWSILGLSSITRASFHTSARSIIYFLSYKVLQKPLAKENTKPVEIKLHTQQRAVKRAIFNYSVATKLYLMEQQKKQVEKLHKLANSQRIQPLFSPLAPMSEECQIAPLQEALGLYGLLLTHTVIDGVSGDGKSKFPPGDKDIPPPIVLSSSSSSLLIEFVSPSPDKEGDELNTINRLFFWLSHHLLIFSFSSSMLGSMSGSSTTLYRDDIIGCGRRSVASSLLLRLSNSFSKPFFSSFRLVISINISSSSSSSSSCFA